MMIIFNRYGMGDTELVKAIGLISTGISFDKWEPVLPLGIRDVAAIIGREPVAALCHLYMEGDDYPGHDEARSLIGYLQQAVALFTWLKIIPTLDAQHDETGRARRLGENEKGLTALQEFKDEENIRRMAYEAVDALIEAMEQLGYEPWLSSRKYNLRQGLLVRSKEEFDEYYNIGSHRLFVTLLPMLREVQADEVAPVLGKHLAEVLEAGTDSPLFDPAARALVLLTMKKAVERLPVEVIPEGIVQIQQSQPVNSRLRAEQSARAAVAASLGADGRRNLDRLSSLVAALDGDREETTGRYISGPLVHSKGMSF